MEDTLIFIDYGFFGLLKRHFQKMVKDYAKLEHKKIYKYGVLKFTRMFPSDPYGSLDDFFSGVYGGFS